ncbi:hypothetical protein [Streptomyces sp. CO7]
MTTPAPTLRQMIQDRLTEISEKLWETHRIQRVPGQDGRIVWLGTAALWSRWTCQADHGSGPCGQALITLDEASVLLGKPVDFSLDDPVFEPVETFVLDPDYGVQITDLVHVSDVRRKFEEDPRWG